MSSWTGYSDTSAAMDTDSRILTGHRSIGMKTASTARTSPGDEQSGLFRASRAVSCARPSISGSITSMSTAFGSMPSRILIYYLGNRDHGINHDAIAFIRELGLSLYERMIVSCSWPRFDRFPASDPPDRPRRRRFPTTSGTWDS